MTGQSEDVSLVETIIADHYIVPNTELPAHFALCGCGERVVRIGHRRHVAEKIVAAISDRNVPHG